LRKKAEAFLGRAGVSQGQTVLDFGCNEGSYALPAARIVGETGTVYALDKNEESLKALMRKAQKKRLQNMKPLHVEEDQNFPLRSASVDAVLLYDTLHGGYFPELPQRNRTLKRICRALKPGGLLSCYPTHLKKYGMTFNTVVAEIAHGGFRLQDKRRRTLIHDGRLVQGWIFSFRKNSSRRRTRP